eukprot:scaffold445641_cov23-Prasinocladus_malaysianus.AAC.1
MADSVCLRRAAPAFRRGPVPGLLQPSSGSRVLVRVLVPPCGLTDSLQTRSRQAAVPECSARRKSLLQAYSVIQSAPWYKSVCACILKPLVRRESIFQTCESRRALNVGWGAGQTRLAVPYEATSHAANLYFNSTVFIKMAFQACTS